MPWVDKDKCTGCRICVEKCPVEAISMEDEKAKISMDKCIRCGICHEVCPQEAVRHDSEKIPQEIKVNVEITKNFMESCIKYLGERKEGQKCLNRMLKHFNKEKIVAEKTLEELEKIRNSLGKNE
ncbi:MAG: 4Fe-4S binding protein [Candidatus Omnitrophica bacterium]|nr:4Fe-4S binding protein [Candidatus Omnitrophota bacterium]